MSSLIFALSETDIILATDTLVTPYDGDAAFFSSKAFMLPHMNMILAASGYTGFLERWLAYINARKIFPGIETLASAAQSELQAMWHEYKQEMALPVESEQAIFHFGISEFTGEMVSFKHISWDDFLPEEISVRANGQEMFFAKPNCAKPDDLDGMGGFPKAFLPMMLDQRTRQAAQPDGKVTIGGEIQIHHLTKAGCAVYKLARFDDYASVEQALWGDFRGEYAARQSQRSDTAALDAEKVVA
jgi:hypothetical protein